MEIVRAEELIQRLLEMMVDVVPQETDALVFTCGIKNRADTARWLRMTEAAGFFPLPEVSLAVLRKQKKMAWSSGRQTGAIGGHRGIVLPVRC